MVLLETRRSSPLPAPSPAMVSQPVPHHLHGDATDQPRRAPAGAGAQAPAQATHASGPDGGERAASGGSQGGSPAAGASRLLLLLLRSPHLGNSQLVMDMANALHVVVVQGVNVWRNWGRSAAPAGQLNTVLVLLATIVGALVPCAATGFYQRNR